MKKKRILIISVIMLIFIIFFTLIILSNKMNEKRINLSITMNSKISDIVYDENKINIYIFWGDGCPHCEEAIKFFNSIEDEYGKYYKLVKYEVWNDQDNSKLMDEVASKFRKMLIIERYHNSELNQLFEDLFINGAIEHEEKIFSELIDAKIIKKDNPHIIALRFYTPIFYLLQKYDMHLDKAEEAKQELTLMVQEFCETYKGEER